MMATSLIGTTLIMRVETPNTAGAFGVLALAVGDAAGVVGAIDARRVTRTTVVRDVSITVSSEVVGEAVRAAIERLPDFRITNVSDATFLAHLGGKIRVEGKMPVKMRADAIAVDRVGAIDRNGHYANPHWEWLAQHTNGENRHGSLGDVLAGADAFIGGSAPDTLHLEDIKKTARDPIVFAMANVIPGVFDTRVVHAVATAVHETAIEEGLARRSLLVQDEESMLAAAQ